jgi:Bacteriophage baseplate protein W
MNIDSPWHFDTHGRTATTDDGIRNMIEQLLFTNPGERLNRPDFGSGLRQLIFGGMSPELATALKLSLQVALQQWLGDVIEVQSLDVTGEDSTLLVSIHYVLRQTGVQQRGQFQRTL